MSEGRVLIGLAVSDEKYIEDEELEEETNDDTRKRGICWYTYRAYQGFSGPYPVKIGGGTDPLELSFASGYKESKMSFALCPPISMVSLRSSLVGACSAVEAVALLGWMMPMFTDESSIHSR